MKVALIDIKGDDNREIKKNTSVNIRNFDLIKNALNCDYLYNTKMLYGSDYDILIFGFACLGVPIEKIISFILKQKNKVKVFWIIGEYQQISHNAIFYYNKRFGYGYEIIKNYDKKIVRQGCTKYHFLNINLLVSKPANNLTGKKYNCIYYGRWRDDRKEYFKKYIQEGVYLSTSIKNMKLFKHNGCNPKYLDTIDWTDGRETLNQFRYSLYIEDKYTHSVFNNLANRWYEAGFCNNVVFFDINCKNTIEKSEIAYHFDPYYYVSNHAELMQKIEECNQDWGKHLAIQKTWRLQEPVLRAKMIEDLKQIIGI
jgi:hypothetical protein